MYHLPIVECSSRSAGRGHSYGEQTCTERTVALWCVACSKGDEQVRSRMAWAQNRLDLESERDTPHSPAVEGDWDPEPAVEEPLVWLEMCM